MYNLSKLYLIHKAIVAIKKHLEGTPENKSLGWYFATDFENDFYKGHYEIISVIFSH